MDIESKQRDYKVKFMRQLKGNLTGKFKEELFEIWWPAYLHSRIIHVDMNHLGYEDDNGKRFIITGQKASVALCTSCHIEINEEKV
jgi:hypothetical protein